MKDFSKPKVFVSYSVTNNNYEFIEKLARTLTNTKAIDVWLDYDKISHGTNIAEVISEGVASCNVFLFYLNKQALKSEWVMLEHAKAQLEKRGSIYYFVDSDETREMLWPELKEKPLRIPVLNNDNFYQSMMEFLSTMLSRFYRDSYPNVNINSVLEAGYAKGIHSIQFGKFTKEDDARTDALILGAKHIRIMMLNGSSFFQIFRKTLIAFFEKGNVQIDLLLANEESIFYNENSVLIHQNFDNNQENKNLVGHAIERAKGILKSAVKDNVLRIRKFNTQFRAPLIIFDDKVAHLTINLPPSESIEGMTLELHGNAEWAYIKECIAHFNAVWDRSDEIL